METNGAERSVTVMFTDIVGSTRLSRRVGDRAAQQLVHAHRRTVRAELERFGGREIAVQGDGFLIAFTSSRLAIHCAVAIQRALVEADEPVDVRIGINAGDVIDDEGGDLFGEAVNVASRVAAQASGGEIIVSDTVRGLVGSLPGVRFIERGLVSLKGVDGGRRLHEVAWAEPATVATSVPPPAPKLDPPARIFGRSDDVRTLTTRVTPPYADVPIVFIEGEAGIGKTALLEHVLYNAGQDGCTVYRGRAEELERNRPFGPLIEALGCIAPAADPMRGEIASLVSGNADVSEFRVVEAIASLTAHEATNGPIVVALDDLHWADPSSLRTLRMIGKRYGDLPLAIVATLRPTPRTDELDAFLAAFTADGATHHILAPLDASAVRDVVADTTGAQPGPRLLTHVESAAGNPLFVTELVRALDDQGSVARADGGAELREASLPPSLRLTILGRISTLPPATLEALRMASILGSSFTVSDLSAITQLSAAELHVRILEAMRANVVLDDGGRLRFRHDVIRESLYEDIPLGMRTGLHLDAARCLAAAGAAPTTVAEHYALGASVGDEDAIEWLTRAAQQEKDRAPTVAIHLFEKVLKLMHPNDPRRPSLKCDLVLPLLDAGRGRDAERLAREAVGETTDHATLVIARRGLAQSLFEVLRWDEGIEVLRDTLELRQLSEFDRASVLAELAGALGTGQERLALAVEAVRLADRTSNVHAKIRGLVAQVDSMSGSTDERMEVLDEAIALARRSTAHRSERTLFNLGLALVSRGFLLMNRDRLDDASTSYREALGLAEDVGAVGYLPEIYFEIGRVQFWAGRWDDALAELEASIASAEEHGQQWKAMPAFALTALIALHRDDLVKAEALIARAETVATTMEGNSAFWVWWARGLLAEAKGDLAGALAALGLTVFGDNLYDASGDLVRVAAANDNENIVFVVRTLINGSSLDTLEREAKKHRVDGHAERNASTVLEGAELYRKSGRPLPLAESLEHAAELLAAGAHRDEAVAALREAREIYEDLSAVRGMSRVTAALRELGVRHGARGKRERPTYGWESLTPTEVDVALLVAEGLSNAEVGRRLFISPRTVGTHLSHAFAKLGVSSRTQLVSHALSRSDSSQR